MTVLTEQVKLEVIIKSTAPLFIADASAGDACLNDAGHIINAKLPKATPVTRTERKPCIVTDRDGQQQVAYFPYIKANNLSGRLRRLAADHLIELYLENERQIPPKSYRGINCGASSGTPPKGDKGQASLSEYVSASNHLYMGLFGGGDKIFPAGYIITDANPLHEQLIDNGMIAEEYRDLAILADTVPAYQLTAPVSLIRRDRMMDFDDVNLATVIKGGEEAVQGWINEIRDVDGESDQEGKSGRKMLKNKVAYEVAIAGITYLSQIEFRAASHDYHVGFLLDCLGRLAQQNHLGGKRGLGRFNMTVKLNGEEALTSIDGVVDPKPIINSYMDSLAEVTDNFDFDELHAFFGE